MEENFSFRIFHSQLRRRARPCGFSAAHTLRIHWREKESWRKKRVDRRLHTRRRTIFETENRSLRPWLAWFQSSVWVCVVNRVRSALWCRQMQCNAVVWLKDGERKRSWSLARFSWFKCFYLVNFSGCLHPMKHWEIKRVYCRGIWKLWYGMNIFYSHKV